ncbi:MAG TPA: tetratricopeptide repeat protein [Aliidongia sp.]|uniref:tetratricopeptide repeat protein n=1 Tax=Aliidongia sp. TaxID=1914230 RepID=UPI002DDD3331|nr:tetratricopeptide repeat protein [Aliidongia sp.]HEV2673657.1 tetratricopeptide repeat protein [Aliidongia sp.]
MSRRPPLRLLASSAIAMTLALSIAACSTPGSTRKDDLSPPSEKASSEGLVRVADDARARGDLVTAIAFYRQAVSATTPAAAALLVKLGDALMATGAFEQASGAYRMASERAPDDETALVGLGSADIALGRPAAAVEPLQRAAGLAPGDLRAHRNLGVALDLTGKHEEARSIYEAALRTAPDDVDLRSDYALSLALTGDGTRAVDMMRAVAASPLAGARHMRNLVLVLGLAGRGDEAGTLARRMLPADDATALMARIAALRALAGPTEQAAALGTTVGG